jgi:hypothetical protein
MIYADKFSKYLIIPYYFENIMNHLEKICTFNQLSPQGMCIFGLISSIYSLTFYHKQLIFKYSFINNSKCLDL